jgi:hypothetical protein
MTDEESTTPDLVERTRKLFERTERFEFDRDMALWSPDAVWDSSALGIGVSEGAAAEFLDLVERLLVGGTIRVRGAGSGVETDIPAWNAVELRDGKVLRWEAFGSKADALRFAGLEG